MYSTVSKRVFSVLVALAMVISLNVPAMAFAAPTSTQRATITTQSITTMGVVNPGATITGGDVISESGVYYLADDATGKIEIGESLDVEIVGNKYTETTESFDESPYIDLNIVVGDGSSLTIRDVYFDTSETADPAIDFLGEGTLFISGHNLLDRSGGYGSNAVIHVGPAASVVFDGDGALYMYKHAQGAGIGANGNETNGEITFDGGTWFIKGSKTGALIGTDTVKGGDITINDGTIYLKAVAQGAAIGTSRMGSAGPDVYVNGGLIQIVTDFSGSAIGYGGQKAGDPGTLTVTGGSLMTIITPNAYPSWGYGDKELTDGAFISTTNVTAAHSGVSILEFDASNYVGQTVTASFDGAAEPFYSGGLYEFIENEVKNPPQQSTPSDEYAGKKSDTLHNWIPNTEDYKLSADDYSGAYPTVYGSALAGTNTLCFWITEDDHVLEVNGDIYDVTWDADMQKFTYEKQQGSVYPWYEDGGAAEGTSYTISTAEELAQFATLVNGTVADEYGYAQDTFKNKTVVLANDIDLSEFADWTPIGGDYKTTEVAVASQAELEQAVRDHGILYDDQGNSYTNSPNGNDKPYSADRTYYYMDGGVFEGTFDGAGKAIDGLTIISGAGVGYRGLFGNNAGTIKDFTISGSIGTADAHIAGGNKDNWGAVAAYNTGTVSGIISKVEIYIDGGEAIGGIVGRNFDGTVEKCGYESKIDCGKSGALSYRAGGIVGNTRGTNSLVTLCYNKAFVSAACYSNGMRGVGGIVGSMGNNSGEGQNGGTVSFCYNTGDITAGGYGGGKQGTGGIVGAISAGDVLNCYSVGTATAPGSAGVIIGKLGGGNFDHLYMLDTARAYQPYGTKTETAEGEHKNQKYADGTDENADGSIKFSGAALANSYNGGYVITNSWVKTDAQLKGSEIIEEINTLKDETTFEGFKSNCGTYPILIWEEATEHIWDEGVVTKEPTIDEPGEMTYTCSVCGATKTEPILWTTPIIVDAREIPATTGKTGARFDVLVPEAGKVVFEVVGVGSATRDVTEGLNADLEVGIAPKNLGDTLKVTYTPEGGEEVDITADYTSANVAIAKQNTAYGNAMKDYGDAAYDYLVAKAVERDITAEAKAKTKADMPYADKDTSGAIDGLTDTGYSLVHNAKLYYKQYFKLAGNISDYSATVNGTKADLVKSGSEYYVAVPAVTSSEWNNTVTVVVSKAGEDIGDVPTTYKVTFSATTYAKSKADNSKATLASLAKTMHCYYEATQSDEGEDRD